MRRKISQSSAGRSPELSQAASYVESRRKHFSRGQLSAVCLAVALSSPRISYADSALGIGTAGAGGSSLSSPNGHDGGIGIAVAVSGDGANSALAQGGPGGPNYGGIGNGGNGGFGDAIAIGDGF